ncbi:hypothetical protein O59_001687 [Cellvibrio sp. BR]|nr:hypothetical protein O59_001687 [Cellvibrio sp. BR]
MRKKYSKKTSKKKSSECCSFFKTQYFQNRLKSHKSMI